MAVKLSDGEARHLAGILAAIARPRNEAEQRELLAWIKRLSGER